MSLRPESRTNRERFQGDVDLTLSSVRASNQELLASEQRFASLLTVRLTARRIHCTIRTDYGSCSNGSKLAVIAWQEADIEGHMRHLESQKVPVQSECGKGDDR